MNRVHSATDKERGFSLSSMHKKAIALALLAASVAAVATTSPPVKVTRLSPTEVHAMATQSAATVQAPVRMQPQQAQYQPQYQQPNNKP